MSGARRRRLARDLKLAALAVLGIASVSIPVTIAVVLSSTGASDVLSVGSGPGRPAAATPAPVRVQRCVARRGYYALTFDDGPFPATTRRLVAALRNAGAVATFFDVGRRAAAHPELVELQRGAGQVAGHGYTHVPLTDVSHARRLQELQATARVLDYPNAFVRPPYGRTDAEVDADLRRSGLAPVYWTVDVRDAALTTAATVAAAARVQPGGIIVLDDGVEATIRAVAPIVRELRRRGLCAGRVAAASRTVLAANGETFRAEAVKP
jgi:peptidoglycan/xylan/chitin deacetylase (PgdA/CDA1 family)